MGMKDDVLRAHYWERDDEPRKPIQEAMTVAHMHIDAAVKIARQHGHGHVYRRSDGVLARCGGPSVCEECKAEKRISEVAQLAAEWPKEW